MPSWLLRKNLVGWTKCTESTELTSPETAPMYSAWRPYQSFIQTFGGVAVASIQIYWEGGFLPGRFSYSNKKILSPRYFLFGRAPPSPGKTSWGVEPLPSENTPPA